MANEFTYEEAVKIRTQWLELQKQLPRIIEEARKTKTMASIARDMQYSRDQTYNILEKRNGAS